MTKFLILEQTGLPTDREVWQQVATVEANSKEQALRGVGGLAGTVVAVPLRSWQPVRLEVETIQRTKITAAETPAESKVDA